jgi:hypothetical protein
MSVFTSPVYFADEHPEENGLPFVSAIRTSMCTLVETLVLNGSPVIPEIPRPSDVVNVEYAKWLLNPPL